MPFGRRTKYGNVSKVFYGYSYHSSLEAKFAAQLDLRVKAKDIKSWERQKRIALTAHGKTIGHYVIDFIAYENDGTKTYIEIKGFPSALWAWKYKHFLAQLAKEEPSARAKVFYAKDI